MVVGKKLGEIELPPHSFISLVIKHSRTVLPAPDVTESEPGPEFTVATLEALVRMKLTAFRLRDRVHLLDLLEVGLIDESWCERFPPELGSRLHEIIESPDREA